MRTTTKDIFEGKLVDHSHCRVLVCYVIANSSDPVAVNRLADLFHYEEIADAFEIADAVEFLKENEFILPVNDEEYTISDIGREVSVQLSNDIPYFKKIKAMNVVLKLNARMRNSRETRFNILEEEGEVYLECIACGTPAPIASFKIHCVDKLQAQNLKDRLLNNVNEIFTHMLNTAANA